MRFYQHPVFDITLPEWWRYQGQMPPGVAFFALPALGALLVPQRWMRPYLLVTSLLILWLTFGHGFTLGILAACVLAWLLCLLARAAVRRGAGPARLALAGGWLIANGIYFGLFATPVNRVLADAGHLDILLLCGPAFFLIRFLGLFSDICRGKPVGSLRPDRFALFFLYAPTFRLGPVTYYASMNEQIDHCKSRINSRNLRLGGLLIALGIGQLVLVDEVINEWLVNPYHERTFFFTLGFFNDAANLTFGQALLGTYLIAFRFLLGFSGYTHLAMGISRLMGIDVPRNFERPYLASNIRTLWHRWHISLSQWLRDYIYIPLGGRNRRLLATLAVFVYCMMWHQPTLNMLIFALIHTGAVTGVHVWRGWLEREEPRPSVARLRAALASPAGYLLGVAATFHFWCLTLLVMFDPNHLGLGVMRRIFVDPFAAILP